MSALLSNRPRFARALRLSWTDRALGPIPWILGALFGAVAIHLLTILALPTLWPTAAYRRLALHLPLGETVLLPRPDAASREPTFADPFAALAVCRFDLSQGPLRLRAKADGDHPFSVSVRLTDGTIIFSGNDRQTPQGAFDVLIVTQAQADALDAAQDSGSDTPDQNAASDASVDPLRLVSPGLRGFAVFRVLALREGDYDAAAMARSSVQCSVEKPAT
ncbi:hypothetical protein [Rhodoblastus sp.]|uniref:DUF1254 domain-containing protein n=1 Tax=Rhodoblastus sp. TaxID=1962975 RepID=UPI0026317240|nr:hypothetical protein [Rhodoblastus sp.]